MTSNSYCEIEVLKESEFRDLHWVVVLQNGLTVQLVVYKWSSKVLLALHKHLESHPNPQTKQRRLHNPFLEQILPEVIIRD